MPEVKPCKPDKNISEPVQTLVRLFKEDPKRFSFEYETHAVENYMFHHVWGERAVCGVSAIKIIDSRTKEHWKYTINLYWEAVEDSHYSFSYSLRRFGCHHSYPVLGCKVTSKPNWITEEEIEFISEALIPYFTDRVNRYREIVNYREERREESHKRKTELDKKKERQRLVNIYKGE
jgi:hypothetical protein